MPRLFKAGDDVMEQALNLSRRREFAQARAKFVDASAKYNKEGNILYDNLAKAYADLMLLGSGNVDPAVSMHLAAFLRTTLGTTELRPGPRGISASDLATQLELSTREANLLAAVQTRAGDASALSNSLQVLANDYRRLGNEILFLPDYFQQRSIPASSKSPLLMALSFETLGTATQATDPLTAAEHFQTAQQYWSQCGDEARAADSARRVAQLSLRAKCWFCGREGSGHGVQFVSMPVDQDLTGLKGLEASPLSSIDKSGRLLYACRGCYSAIKVLADAIAARRSAEVEQRLNAEIQILENQIQALARSLGRSVS